ncbi:MAG: YihA family ribosome biogenesis GTP-binding protein [Firmicutes bacterium]|nr:YihA family ribosome biogenesis GTP-binding protein [Bacillota bacterium]
MKLNLHNSEFLTSAVEARGYPRHSLEEIALVGRSNVGKSSLLNTLVNRKKFARTSNRPGRTQMINFYRVDTICFVDLPGYGFARVPEKVRQKWGPMIESYLTERPNLAGILHLVDLRHKPTKDDLLMAAWIKNRGLPSILIATKTDKISRGQRNKQQKIIKASLGRTPLLFSAHNRQGRDEILTLVADIVQK